MAIDGLNPYLVYAGNCEEAFKFYEKTLGGKIEMMMPHEGTPAESHVPKEWLKKIMHVSMKVGDMTLMGSDAPPDRYTKPGGFSVSLQVADPAEGGKLFAALSEGGTVTMPFQSTFWAKGFGMCTDRFGIPWMVNCA